MEDGVFLFANGILRSSRLYEFCHVMNFLITRLSHVFPLAVLWFVFIGTTGDVHLGWRGPRVAFMIANMSPPAL